MKATFVGLVMILLVNFNVPTNVDESGVEPFKQFLRMATAAITVKKFSAEMPPDGRPIHTGGIRN